MLALRLAFLRAMDATEADTFRAGVVQYLDGVTVEDRPSEVSERGIGEKEGRFDRCASWPLIIPPALCGHLKTPVQKKGRMSRVSRHPASLGKSKS